MQTEAPLSAASKTSLKLFQLENSGILAPTSRPNRQSVKLPPVPANPTPNSTGDFEYAMGVQTHSCSHRAMGSVETLILDLQNIERLVNRKNQRTLELVKLLVLEKTRQRLQQLGAAESSDESDAPLFAMAAARLQEEVEARESRQRQQQQQLQQRQQSVQEKEVAALTRLFLLDRAQLILPCVPGSLTVKLHSQRQRQYWSRRLREKEEHNREIQDKVTRRDFHIQARSLRQLANYHRDTPEPELRESDLAGKKKDVVNEILETTTVRNSSGEKISLMVMLKMMQRLKEVRRRLSMKSTSGDQQKQRDGSAWLAPRTRSAGSTTSSAPSVFDEETSDATLQGLEERIGEFLKRCCVVKETAAASAGAAGSTEASTKSAKGVSATISSVAVLAGSSRATSARSDGVTRLRRYDLDPDKVPLPGGTVLVKRKPCSGQSDHQHVRHYVLPNNALRILQAHSAVRMQRDRTPQPLPTAGGLERASSSRPSLRGNKL